MKLRYEIIIDVCREKVFDLFIDGLRWPEYIDYVVAVKELMPVNNELRYLVTYKAGTIAKGEVQITERIYNIRKPESYMFTHEMEGIENNSIVKFIPVNEHSTRMITEMNVSSKSFLLRLLMRISAMASKKKTRKMFASFKSYAESLPAS